MISRSVTQAVYHTTLFSGCTPSHDASQDIVERGRSGVQLGEYRGALTRVLTRLLPVVCARACVVAELGHGHG